MRKMYIQPKVEEMVLPQDPFMLGGVSKGENPNEDEMAHAPERRTKVY